MTYKLLITQDANNDIDEIVSYIVNEESGCRKESSVRN